MTAQKIASIFIMVQNSTEREDIERCLSPYPFTLIFASPSYRSYIKTLQYNPDALVVELPKACSDQLHYIQSIKQHRTAQTIPIISFGSEIDPAVKDNLSKIGVSHYFERPNHLAGIEMVVRSIHPASSVSEKSEVRDVKNENGTGKLLQSSASAGVKISSMLNRVTRLMAFPHTVLKILKLTSNDNAGVRELAKAIEADPVIAAKLIKVCNSAAYRSRGRDTTTIKDALVRIGFNETRRIAMSMSVMRVLGEEDASAGFNRIEFWKHCISTAVIARLVAESMGDVDADEAFLCGLLHDFGIILLDEFFPKIFRDALSATTDKGGHFSEELEEQIGFSHSAITQRLFVHWKLPESICEGIAYRKVLSERPLELKKAGERLALCVALGTTIAKTLALGASCDHFVVPMPNWMFAGAGIPEGLTPALLKQIDVGLQTYREFNKVGVVDDDGSPQHYGSTPLVIGVARLTDAVFFAPEHYCRATGNIVEQIMREDIEVENNSFDAIIIAANRFTTESMVEPFTRVPRKRRGSRDGGKAELAPIIFLREREASNQLSEIRNAIFLYEDLDLRHIDLALATLVQDGMLTENSIG
ncbi:MAG: HDOD domain-containing protein [Chitinivibrionales bacterium]|nr:HDOD domain-containing protein [Chitinivibrionales bacterium]MBD3358174.1 HDOD domain-containing protein [Chitinivibrionales bacterium]